MPAFAPRFTITNAIAMALTAIERSRGFLEAAKLSEEWIERMSQRALLLEACHTTHIKGTQLTLDEAARLWAGEEVPGASDDDVRERKHGLNERQAVVVEALMEGDPLGIEEVEALVPGVTRRTLQRDLRGLVEADIAVAEGAARATHYSLSDKGVR